MEPGREVELAVPRQLGRLLGATSPEGARLARREPAAVRAYSEPRGALEIGPTDSARLARLFRTELREPIRGYMTPQWADPEGPIPGLVISLRYEGQDAFGITTFTRQLDLAFRRAAAMMNALYDGEKLPQAIRPAIRPEGGGLWVIEAQRGSYELHMTVYGTLVMWATSAPVSLISFASLLWNASAKAKRVGSWVAGVLDRQVDEVRPTFGSQIEGPEWALLQTKALAPVLLEAVRSGNGVEFVNNSSTGEIRLTVPPRGRLESDGQ